MTKRKVLVTGANGFVGKPLCRTLCEKGYHVTAVIRPQATEQLFSHPNLSIQTIKALSPQTSWQPLLKNHTHIIHLASRVHQQDKNNVEKLYDETNHLATKHLAESASRAGISRLIFLSTIGVNGQTTKNHAFTESSAADPQTPYARSKFAAEKALFDIAKHSNLEITIIRPPVICGTAAKGNYAHLMKLLSMPLPVLPFGAINNQRSLLTTDELNSLIALCLEHPAAANQIFLAAESTFYSTPELIKKIASGLNKKITFLKVPLVVLSVLLKLVGKHALYPKLCDSLMIDASKARQLLNWQPTEDLDNNIIEMTNYFLQEKTV